MIMKEEELRQLLKTHGWNLFTRTKRSREYFYAQKWRMGEVYISPKLNVESVRQEEVLKKIGVAS